MWTIDLYSNPDFWMASWGLFFLLIALYPLLKAFEWASVRVKRVGYIYRTYLRVKEMDQEIWLRAIHDDALLKNQKGHHRER